MKATRRLPWRGSWEASLPPGPPAIDGEVIVFVADDDPIARVAGADRGEWLDLGIVDANGEGHELGWMANGSGVIVTDPDTGDGVAYLTQVAQPPTLDELHAALSGGGRLSVPVRRALIDLVEHARRHA